MNRIDFAWDPGKNEINIQKHGVSFEEAQSVFYDERAIIIYDSSHSEKEDRFVLLGISKKFRYLVVCHCYQEDDSIIRIISARKATQREQIEYRDQIP